MGTLYPIIVYLILENYHNNDATIIEHCTEMFKDELSVLKKGEIHLQSQAMPPFLFGNGVANASFCFTLGVSRNSAPTAG